MVQSLHLAWVLATSLFAAPALAALPLDEADEKALLVDGLFERQLFDRTIREAETFLSRHGGHRRADGVRYRLASAFFETDRPADAIPHFERLAGTTGFISRAEASLRLGQCQLATGDPSAAADALQRTLQLGQDYLRGPATFLLAEALFEQGRFRPAGERYAEVLEQDPDGPYGTDAAAGLAWCAHRTSDHDQVVTRATDLLAGDLPDELAAEMFFLLGESQLELDRAGQALQAYGEVSSGPFVDAALRGAGFAQRDLGQLEQAEATFVRLLAEHPDSRFASEASLQLGILRLDRGDLEGAAQAFDAPALGDDAESLYWRARVRGDQGQAAEALRLLDRAEATGPDEELLRHIRTARGNVLAADGRAEEAARAYAQAGSDDALHAAAVAELNAGRPERALQLVDPIVARGEADGAVLLTRAESLFLLERHAEAERGYEEALQRATPSTAARIASRLAWCRYLQDDGAGAAERFARVARDHPEAPEAEEALFMEGHCRQDLGDTAGAASAWNRYLQRHPEGARRAEVRLGLAAVGTGDEVRQQLERLLAEGAEGPVAASALFELADHLAAEGDFPGAERRYAQLIDEHPRSELAPAAHYGRAFCLSEQGRHDDAVTWLAPLTDSRSTVGDAELRRSALELLVWCHHGLGRPAQAEEAFHRLAASGAAPERVLDASRTAAAAWQAAGEAGKAVALLDRVAASSEVSVGALVEGAWAARDAGDTAGAEDRVRRALRQAPDDAAVAEAAFFVAESLFAAGEDERAIPLYAAASRAADSPVPDEALYKEGFARLRQGDNDGARTCFRRLVDHHADSPLVGESLFLQGEASYRLDDDDAAVPPLRQLLSEHPDHEVSAKARFRLGLVHARRGDWSEAESALSDLARRHPGFEHLTEAELWRGRSLVQLGRDRAARAAFERVVATDKGVLSARARIEMGSMELDGGNAEEALSEFLKVALLYAHDEEVAHALLLAGQCLESLGETDSAADRYREILDKHPETTFASDARRRLQAL